MPAVIVSANSPCQQRMSASYKPPRSSMKA